MGTTSTTRRRTSRSTRLPSLLAAFPEGPHYGLFGIVRPGRRVARSRSGSRLWHLVLRPERVRSGGIVVPGLLEQRLLEADLLKGAEARTAIAELGAPPDRAGIDALEPDRSEGLRGVLGLLLLGLDDDARAVDGRGRRSRRVGHRAGGQQRRGGTEAGAVVGAHPGLQLAAVRVGQDDVLPPHRECREQGILPREGDRLLGREQGVVPWSDEDPPVQEGG